MVICLAMNLVKSHGKNFLYTKIKVYFCTNQYITVKLDLKQNQSK